MKKIITFYLLCAMSASMLTSCGKPNLEGEWKMCNADGNELDCTVRFKDDGKIKVDDRKGDYEVVDKDTVEIKIGSEKYECDFEIIDKDESLIYLGEFSDDTERKVLDSMASTLLKATNSALCDMDEEDKYYKDNAVICSDSSKNINAVPENADDDFDFAEHVKPFFNDINDYDYIIYIGNSVCVYTALKSPSGDIVGTSSSMVFEDMTFDEVYEEFKSNIE